MKSFYDKFITFILALSFVFTFAFAEYRFIMRNIEPYIGENNSVYLVLFGLADTYYAESLWND